MKATATLILLLATTTLAAAAPASQSCFTDLAETRNYTLGQPTHVLPAPAGHAVYYLRSAARDTTLHLYAYDAATKTERELARPESSDEHLSTEEKARRERARMTLKGITDFTLSDDGGTMLATEGDALKRITLPDGHVSPLPGHGWIAPRLSPDGKFVTVVRDNDLHVLETSSGNDTQLTHGASETLTRGLAEFAAAEELGRADGAWWSPDSSRLVYEEADTSKVEMHYIADPGIRIVHRRVSVIRGPEQRTPPPGSVSPHAPAAPRPGSTGTMMRCPTSRASFGRNMARLPWCCSIAPRNAKWSSP